MSGIFYLQFRASVVLFGVVHVTPSAALRGFLPLSTLTTWLRVSVWFGFTTDHFSKCFCQTSQKPCQFRRRSYISFLASRSLYRPCGKCKHRVLARASIVKAFPALWVTGREPLTALLQPTWPSSSLLNFS